MGVTWETTVLSKNLSDSGACGPRMILLKKKSNISPSVNYLGYVTKEVRIFWPSLIIQYSFLPNYNKKSSSGDNLGFTALLSLASLCGLKLLLAHFYEVQKIDFNFGWLEEILLASVSVSLVLPIY